MKCRTVKSEQWRIQWVLLALFAFCFASCKDSEDRQAKPYDPNQPVEITSFSPDEGGGNTRIVVYGKNFGTDMSLLNLTIGGKKAKIISVLGDYMYAIVPQKAFKGNVGFDSTTLNSKIVLTIGEGEQAKRVEAKTPFKYVRQVVVSTLCGKEDEKGNYDVKNGPFDDCGGIAEATWFSFDPQNKDILYLAQDNGKKMRVLDLKNEQIYYGVTNGNGLDRMRTITWTHKGDTMIIANDKGEDHNVNNYYIVRDKAKPIHEAFVENPEPMMQGKGCNGSAIHPVNGELYYNSFQMGDVFRYDYLAAIKPDGGFDFTKTEKLFVIQDRDWEFNFVIHPTGSYAYIIVINKHYIMRTDYDWKTKRFGTPYLFCGVVGGAGWVDATGDQARLAKPYQGVFVLNKQYEQEKREDIYDFYFTDRDNHCIRYLTPDGSITTFAGRGSAAMNPNPYGLVNGGLRSEARFDKPCALAYDEETETFYVGDVENHCIRKIAMEKGDEGDEEGEGEGESEGENN